MVDTKLPKAVIHFTDTKLDPPQQQGENEVSTINLDIVKKRLEDIAWRIVARKRFGYILLGLLLVQNILVFGLVFGAFQTKQLDKLQTIFSVLVSATLVETAYIIKIIVEWLFRDIDYTTK